MFSSILMILSAVFAYELKPGLLKDVTSKVLNPPALEDVFIPPGFDDTDNVEITFMNTIPNACYLTTQVSGTRIDKQSRKITLKVESTVVKADFCAARVSFFPTTVSLGSLPEGEYDLNFETAENEAPRSLKFKVSHSANSNRDDFEYASLTINTLTIHVNKEKKQIELNLPVVFMDGCYGFKEIKVLQRSNRVIEVLPIVELKTNVCTQALVFTSEPVIIPYSETQVRKLVHIRSANGFSVNRLVDLD